MEYTIVHKYEGFKAVNANEAAAIIGCHRVTVLNKSNPNSPMYDPTFPQKLVLGRRSLRWDMQEIIAWAKSKKLNNSFHGGYDE